MHCIVCVLLDVRLIYDESEVPPKGQGRFEFSKNVDLSSVYIHDLSTEPLFHTPSIAFRHLPPWRKNVVNQCLEFAIVYEISYVLGMLVHH